MNLRRYRKHNTTVSFAKFIAILLAIVSLWLIFTDLRRYITQPLVLSLFPFPLFSPVSATFVISLLFAPLMRFLRLRSLTIRFRRTFLRVEEDELSSKRNFSFPFRGHGLLHRPSRDAVQKIY